MADFVTNFVAMATGVGHGRIHHYTILYHPENDFSGFLDPRTDPDGVMLGKRMRRPSWTPSWITPFCPTFGMSTQVFFNLLWVPYRDQESKLWDI